ncbi:MAG: cupin domain-containing protein [Chloroflexi bacterium]|nr:cupin domain-containing protein [Chloroflexota bacterium]
MADAGDALENPVTAERVVFRKRGGETSGELLQFDLFMKPHSVAMPEHVHPRQEERIEVVSGTVRFRLGGKEEGLSASQTVVLPPGIPHTVWNGGGDEAHVLVEARPALKTETAIETVFGLARDGKVNKRGLPNPLQGALLAREYETFFAWPPVPVQRLVLAALAPIARRLGYRARYPQYSGRE